MPATATDRLFGLTTSVAVKAPCKAVATTNISLAGLQTISGVTVTEEDRVLVTSQSSGADNGIYLASTGTWRRAADFDGARDAVQGTQIPIVRNGAQTALYEVATANPITIGSTAITFTLRYSANLQYDITAAEIAALVTPVNYIYPSLHAFRYMTSAQIADVLARTLTLDVRAALQTAISVAQQTPGGTVYLPGGSYLIRRVAGGDSQFNGVHIPYANIFGYTAHVKLIGDGRATVLCAGDNSMTVIRLSASNCTLWNLAIDGNGKTGVTGLSLIGSNTSNGALVEHVDHNHVLVDIRSCSEGVEMESPSGGGCYYNTFHGGIWQDNTRHLRLRDNAVALGANRNRFENITMIGGNCGVDIDGADTNMFMFCSFEGIGTGTSPLAVPTAIRVNSAGSVGLATTADNGFVCCQCESNTRDLDNSNTRTHIILGTIGNQASGGLFGAIAGSATPNVWVGGDAFNRLRELLLGDASADGMLVEKRISSLSAKNCVEVASSADAAGAFPFNNDGSLILKARRSASSGIAIRWGATSQHGITGNTDGTAELTGPLIEKQGAVQTVTDGYTILSNGIGQAVTSTASNRTGVILEAGQHAGQCVRIVNINAGTITFATDDTSNVLNGTAVTIPAYSNRTATWYATSSRWVVG